MDTSAVEGLLSSTIYQRMSTFIEEQQDAYIQEICRICEIPAPPFQEDRRARFVARRFREAGFEDVEIDAEGNVVVTYPHRQPGRGALVVSAHLDTVFPAGTDIRVRTVKGRLLAPGISDNSAAVAALLFLARGLREARFEPGHELIFLANVGEEGLGDLRGMKSFFRRGPGTRHDVRAVLVLDGPLGVLGHRGIGSRRLRVTYRGPGGHSWGDFGRPSAIHALGNGIAAISRIKTSDQPRTTYNIGVVEGGTAVNAIAESAHMLVDLRSEEAASLRRLEAAVHKACRQVLVEGLTLDVEVVGDRPIGWLPGDHPLVRLVVATGRAFNLRVRCVASSTDANLPLSLGIPSVSVGIKRGGGAHTYGEYLRIASILPGFRFGTAILLGFSRWVRHASPPARAARSSPRNERTS